MAYAPLRPLLSFALRFAFRGEAATWARMLLPALIGGLSFYFSLDLYLLQLQRYLAHPSERIATLILGIATGGLLLTLFAHSVSITTVVSAALGREDKGWKYFCVSRRAWRVYAAHLRLLAVCAALIILVATLGRMSDGQPWAAIGEVLVVLGITGGLIYLCVRIGFLLAPVGCAEDHGPIIREAWRLSYRPQVSIAMLVILFLATGLGVEIVCETVLKLTLPAIVLVHSGSLPELVASYRGVLWAVVMALGVAYIPWLMLVGPAAAAVLKQIKSPSDK